MKNTYWLALCCLLLAACKSQQPSADNATTTPTLFSIAGEPVSEREFLYVYNKNNISRDTTLQPTEDLRQYLDLYINFKLKVREAREKGLHQQASFQEELDSYKKQLARPYLTESSVTEQLVNEAYQRMATEINASHILIAVNPGAAPADTLAAYQKAQDMRQRAQQGADFGDLARRFSDDPSAQSNRGNLGYFTALQMVYPFENTAYTTPVGAVSAPVRTRFGYHVLKVHDKRPSQGKIKVAHLMVRTQPEMSAEEQAAAKARVDALYQQLQQGESWEALVRQFSEDRSTAPKGGELQPFSTGQMIPEFEKVAFTLKEKGSIAPPVQTPYGWHIIKLLEREGLPPLDDIRDELEARVSRDSRSQLQEEALIARLKKENGFSENKAALQALLQQADSSLLQGSWNYQPAPEVASQLLFSLADSSYTTGDFVAWLSEHPYNRQAAAPETLLNRLYQDWQKEEIIAYEEAHLEEKYEDYRMLVQEYHDGILLFQLMEENVWAKALEDTTGLQQFFAQHQQNYQWQERIEGLVLNAANETILQQAETLLASPPYRVASKTLAEPVAEKGALTPQSRRELGMLMASMLQRQDLQLQIEAPQETAALFRSHLQESGFEASRYKLTQPAKKQPVSLSLLSSSPLALEQRFNAREPLNLQVISGPFERGDHPVVDAIRWQPGRYRLAQDGRQYLVVVQEVVPPGPKTLDQARGQAITDYQHYLEQQWVARLRDTYEVRVNKKELDNLLERQKN
ncbi:peptidylprolyl isomerase [Cesiribacter andamanensis]|uniref:Peptidyl-prolyl cis-trans isomerase surA n=1 Tax=Cesiribacter andamanensis AMV16 TaxID=1279009 RepID=M7NLL1_9BACT|nr:peptidylprolyl isomerase [Cesiribacter andamanensis]EMR02670.1 Peptidyl-prolyl cis-trans isomerase surA [Cesiribacter andamanensis AMV16]